MEKWEVRDIVNRLIEDDLEDEYCPECKDDILCVKFNRYMHDELRTYYRCMGCLKLFERKMFEVVHIQE